MNIQLSSVQCFWFLGLLSANPISGNTLKICHYVTYYLRQNRKCKNQHYWGALSEAHRNSNYSCIWVIFLPFLISLWPTPLPGLAPHLSLRRQWSYWQGNQSVSIQSTVDLATLMVRINPLISQFWLYFFFSFFPHYLSYIRFVLEYWLTCTVSPEFTNFLFIYKLILMYFPSPV